ncbi:hypothetical protein [Exiguobacterium sp. s140]|uniref:hypothetical protein n=1 Tax=Exiguobacterium sp. s140 TaxID=2751290 RepID=UPI001BE5476D|nr:hypothetical protein [Exiguobacterium sp. s140]
MSEMNIEHQSLIFNQMESEGYILEIVPHDQSEVSSDNDELIEKGMLKKITYTASIFNSDITDLIDARSCETFAEALKWATKWYLSFSKKKIEIQ